MINLYGMDFWIEQPTVPFIALILVFLLFMYFRREKKTTRGRGVFLFIRLLIFAMILIALASPYVLRLREEIKGVSIGILEDSSKSTELYSSFGDEIYQEISDRTKNDSAYQITLKKFSEGDTTEIGNALYQESIKESRNDVVLLISDGNNNYGRDPADVARILADTTKILAITPDQNSSEIYVSEIGGERKIPVNTEYKTWIKISKLGGRAKYTLKLFVDDKLVRTDEVEQDSDIKTVEFVFSFNKPGVHTLNAQVIPKSEDYFKENNYVRKIIDIVERPQVLVISKNSNSPLVQVLEKNYKVLISPELAEGFEKYDLVLLDNQKLNDVSPDLIDPLSKYLTDGNGLVVVGGENSFERGDYENSNLERILPVISGEKPKEKRKPIAVVFCIDTSASFAVSGTSGYKSYLEEVKAIAVNLLRQLDKGDSVAVLAFNAPVWTIIDLTEIGDNEGLIEDSMLRLKPATSSPGGTRYLTVLSSAKELLKNYTYDSYIVFLTDGFSVESRSNDEAQVLSLIDSIADSGTKMYTISGGDRAQALEGQKFMQEMAARGKGLYFWMEEGQRLNAAFKEEEEESKGTHTVKIYDQYHFITKDLKIDTKIKDFNGVTAKTIAQVLVSTIDKKPIVTVWRFGLGRVVTLTTDNGALWSGNLYTAENGLLISRIMNWAIQDLEKKKPVKISAEDISLGDRATVLIKTDSRPKLSVTINGSQRELDVKQVDLSLFSSSFTPDSEGMYKITAENSLGNDVDAIAVNTKAEYLTLGINAPELEKIAEMTNGTLYNSSEKEKVIEEILSYAKEKSVRKINARDNLRDYFILTALVLFFLDVILRRVWEILRLRKS